MSAQMSCGNYELPPGVEAERMRAVEQLYLLDSAPEDRFAQITRMARLVFEVPMAAVSLLDSERQWFKQADGLDLEGSVPRAQTVCQATIRWFVPRGKVTWRSATDLSNPPLPTVLRHCRLHSLSWVPATAHHHHTQQQQIRQIALANFNQG